MSTPKSDLVLGKTPYPPLGKNKQRIIQKALLESLRADWYAKRLAKKRKGKESTAPNSNQAYREP
jgi:hypothetical protein